MILAEVFFRKISGETEEEIVSQAEVEEVLAEEIEESEPESGAKVAKKKKPKVRTVYERERSIRSTCQCARGERTIRIGHEDAEGAESDDPAKRKREAAEELRRVVSSVGKQGQPGSTFGVWFQLQC